jgi:hypothetical protein
LHRRDHRFARCTVHLGALEIRTKNRQAVAPNQRQRIRISGPVCSECAHAQTADLLIFSTRESSVRRDQADDRVQIFPSPTEPPREDAPRRRPFNLADRDRSDRSLSR